jgi:hypothetical protein
VLLSEPQAWVKSLPWVTLKRVGQICLPKNAIERCISIYIYSIRNSHFFCLDPDKIPRFFFKIIIHPHPVAEDSHYILSFFQLMDIFGTSDGCSSTLPFIGLGRVQFPPKKSNKGVVFKVYVNLPQGNQYFNQPSMVINQFNQ